VDCRICGALHSAFSTDIFAASGGCGIKLAGDRVAALIGVIVFIAALLISVVGTDLHAAARVNDCLAAPNASSPWGQHWSYRIDQQNNRKCWYLHATLGLLHRPAKPSDLHAPSSAAGAPMSGSSAGSAPRLPHIRKLVVKPQPAPRVSTITKETIKRSDAPSISQEFPLQGSTPQMDRSQPADVSAAPGTTPEAATLGVAVADADAVRPDADNTKPAAATAMGGAADADVVRPDAGDTKLAAATAMGAVADADAVRPDAQNSDGGGLIAERSKSTIVALANALMTPLQMFFLIVFGVASAVFLISLWIIHRRGDHEQPDGLSVHEWRGQNGMDNPPPWRRQSSARRPQSGAVTERLSPSFLGDFRPALRVGRPSFMPDMPHKSRNSLPLIDQTSPISRRRDPIK
jgi:hypothetical protein